MSTLLFLAVGCAASPPPQAVVTPQPADPIPFGPGPTVQSRVAGGYQLINRDLRVVISDLTGDVTYFGVPKAEPNLIGDDGLRAIFNDSIAVPMTGFIEARDEQTWQFFGDDGNGIRWRKIYCLEGDHLYASFIVQNTTTSPVAGRIAIIGGPHGPTLLKHDFEHFDMTTAGGVVSIHGWNLDHDETAQLPAAVRIASDVLSLQPDQRLGYTTDWHLQPPGSP
jgi:hypothetical protein